MKIYLAYSDKEICVWINSKVNTLRVAVNGLRYPMATDTSSHLSIAKNARVHITVQRDAPKRTIAECCFCYHGNMTFSVVSIAKNITLDCGHDIKIVDCIEE